MGSLGTVSSCCYSQTHEHQCAGSCAEFETVKLFIANCVLFLLLGILILRCRSRKKCIERELKSVGGDVLV